MLFLLLCSELSSFRPHLVEKRVIIEFNIIFLGYYELPVEGEFFFFL